MRDFLDFISATSNDQMTFLLCFVAAPIFMALIGLGIGQSRGRPAFGFLLGLILGPIGWLITLLLPREGRRCTQCLGVVPDEAFRCMHCGQALSTFHSLRR